MTFAAPSALYWLAAIPLVWLVARFGRTDFDRRQRYLQAGVRSLVAATTNLSSFLSAEPMLTS